MLNLTAVVSPRASRMFVECPVSLHQWWSHQTPQKSAPLYVPTLAAVRNTSNCPIFRCTAANTQVRWYGTWRSHKVGIQVQEISSNFIYLIFFYRREAVPVWRHRMWSQILPLRSAKEASASTHRYGSLQNGIPRWLGDSFLCSL